MKTLYLSILICSIGLFFGMNNSYAQTITCMGVNYQFENGNIYQLDNKGGKNRIGYNAKGIKCYDDAALLALMPDGNTLRYAGKPNFWTLPCDSPAGSYYQAGKKTMVRGDRVYTGHVLISSDNNKYFALLTNEGNLTLNKVTKEANCSGNIYFVDYQEVWRAPSTTWGPTKPGGYVQLQDDGHLCMYTKENGYRWCAPYSLHSLKVEIDEYSGCLTAWGQTSLLWSSCK